MSIFSTSISRQETGWPATGSKNVDHIRDNFGLFDFTLTDEEMAEIAKLNTGTRYYHRSDEQLAGFASWRPQFETE